MNTYRLILQNNATKEIHSIGGLVNTSETDLYLKFDDVSIDTLEDGEYTYYCIMDNFDDTLVVVLDEDNGGSVVLDFDIVVYDKGVEVSRTQLRDINPLVGLLRIGDVAATDNSYNNEENKTYYYEG